MPCDVLFISIDGMTDPLGQSQVIPYLVGLAQKGHHIRITSLEKRQAFVERQDYVRQILDKAGIAWHPVMYYHRVPLLSQALNYFRLLRTSRKIVHEHLFSIVHCRNVMAGMIGLHLKNRFRCRLVFDMRGFWADERLDGNIWKLSNPIHRMLYRYFKRKETELYLRSDYIISLTEEAVKEFSNWPALKKAALRVQVIPCCVDLSHFSYEKIDPVKKNTLEKSLGILPTDMIISYLGSLGTWYMLDEMLEFFSCLLKETPHARFLLITGDKPEIVYAKLNLFNIPSERVIVRKALREEVPLYVSLSEISLFFIKPTFSKKASSPTKLAEVLGMGLPVITNRGIGDCDKIIAEEKAGILIASFDKASYTSAVRNIDTLLDRGRPHYRNIAEKYFSLELGIERYNNVYIALYPEK